MSDLATLFTAFAVAWAIACGYLWHLARRSADLSARLDALERRAKRDG